MIQDTQPLRILVADDESDFLEAAALYFRQLGWEMAGVTDGRQIAPALEEREADALVSDVNMPGCGPNLLALREVRSKHPDLPIIIVTGAPSMTSMLESLRTRAFDYIAKPFEMDYLAVQIRTAVDRARLQRALRASENLYRSVFENTGTATVLLADDGTIVRANGQFLKFAGLKRAEVEGKRNLGSFVAPVDQAKWRYYHAHRRENPTAIPRNYELLMLPGQGGEQRTMYAMVQAIPGTATRVCSYLDMTDFKRAERAAAQASRIEAMATLAGGLAHQFNNLMVVVLGNAQLLAEEVADRPQAREMLGEIADAASRVGVLTGQMTAFARGGKFESRNVDLNMVIEQVVTLHRRDLRPGVELAWDPEPCIHGVRADETQITQLMDGAIENALEALGDSGRVLVRTRNVFLDERHAHDHPGLIAGDHVSIEVEDTGEGMDAETRERIFEPFFTTKFQGRGLGLAAIYGIVKNHSGHITVDSEKGVGTRVSILIPADVTRPMGAPLAAPERVTGTETILVVDDELVVLRVLEKSLARLGYSVLTATSAEDALATAQSHAGSIDLAILDLHMPGRGGYELFGPLKDLRPDCRVLISSGFDADHKTDFLLQSGAVGFLRKPYTIETLGAEVRRALRDA
jgi:PAS domain S-box-containing protein